MGPLSIATFLTFAAVAIPIATVPVDDERTIVQLLLAIVLCTFVVAVPTASTHPKLLPRLGHHEAAVVVDLR